MKKPILAAALSAAILSAAIPFATVASADSNYSECDKLFEATICSLVEAEDVSGKLTATRKPLYDIEVNPLGYVYEFNINGEDGYAVFTTSEDGNFVPQEFMPESASPYAETTGKCIYVSGYNYLEYSDGVYTNPASGEVIPDEAIEIMAENALFGGGGDYYTTSVTYEYVNKTKDNYNMAYLTPSYRSTSLPNACAGVAGANILGFYDRYYDDLISDFTAGSYILGTLYRYNYENERIMDVIIELYDDMQITANGTTVSGFKSGMQKYCNRYGYNISFNSCMSGGKFNYSTAQNYIKNMNQPIALFLLDYNVADIIEGDNYDRADYTVTTANHVMVGFGYRQLIYTYKSGAAETINFMYVAVGDPAKPTGYYNPAYNTTVDDAFAVNIY